MKRKGTPHGIHYYLKVKNCSESLKSFYEYGTNCVDKLNKEGYSIRNEMQKIQENEKNLIEEMEQKHDQIRENVSF